MKKKVYVVTEFWLEDFETYGTEVLGVFTTKEKAKESIGVVDNEDIHPYEILEMDLE